MADDERRGVRRYVLSAPSWRTGVVWRIEAAPEELPDRVIQYIAETAPGFADAETSEHLERLESEVEVENWGAGPWPRNHHLRGEVVPEWDE
ncbi:MAG: hypothetical protein M3Q49_05955 [Actinomycetota bacterium]|nr:hypothetical protein [Actinomycetota bacterium]